MLSCRPRNSMPKSHYSVRYRREEDISCTAVLLFFTTGVPNQLTFLLPLFTSLWFPLVLLPGCVVTLHREEQGETTLSPDQKLHQIPFILLKVGVSEIFPSGEFPIIYADTAPHRRKHLIPGPPCHTAPRVDQMW